MNIQIERLFVTGIKRFFFIGVAAACLLFPRMSPSQGLTGRLFVTVTDPSHAVIPGAEVSVSSSALIGGPATRRTDEKGQSQFQNLTPGLYVIDVQTKGFTPYHEENLRIRGNDEIKLTAPMALPGISTVISVEEAGFRKDVGDGGFRTIFGFEDLRATPTSRTNFADLLRGAPLVSPTSPTSGMTTATTISVAGSGTNENQFLFDGTNFTCSCNGVARAEPGMDFIQEIQIQSVGASVEYGNVQGGVVNVITRQGSNRFLYDASYYGQPPAFASQPVRFPLTAPKTGESGYERVRFHDFTTSLGGPVVRDRAWFYAGYQHRRDADSQPGADPAFPRAADHDKIFAKVTWKPTPNLQLDPSFHDEFWVNPDRPTYVTPWEAIVGPAGSITAITFHLPPMP